MKGDDRLRTVRDDYDASWIRDAVLPFEAYAVGSLVPVAFEAYSRILHPAWGRSGEPVRWDSVAAWSGRTAHALAEFDRLAAPRASAIGPAPFERRPDDGALPLDALAALCDVVAVHTTTPDDCFVGVWEGFGWTPGSGLDTLRLRLPERVHLIFEGPLAAVDDVGWTAFDGRFIREAPTIMWPADRAWFVSSDVDLDSTFVGGTRALLDALVADPRLEAWPVRPTDPITADSDAINLT